MQNTLAGTPKSHATLHRLMCSHLVSNTLRYRNSNQQQPLTFSHTSTQSIASLTNHFRLNPVISTTSLMQLSLDCCKIVIMIWVHKLREPLNIALASSMSVSGLLLLQFPKLFTLPLFATATDNPLSSLKLTAVPQQVVKFSISNGTVQQASR